MRHLRTRLLIQPGYGLVIPAPKPHNLSSIRNVAFPERCLKTECLHIKFLRLVLSFSRYVGLSATIAKRVDIDTMTMIYTLFYYCSEHHSGLASVP